MTQFQHPKERPLSLKAAARGNQINRLSFQIRGQRNFILRPGVLKLAYKSLRFVFSKYKIDHFSSWVLAEFKPAVVRRNIERFPLDYLIISALYLRVRIKYRNLAGRASRQDVQKSCLIGSNMNLHAFTTVKSGLRRNRIFIPLLIEPNEVDIHV